MDDIKEENRGELVDILDSYFDPEKEAIVPPSKPNTRRRSFKKGSPRENRRPRNGDKLDKKHPVENNNNEVLATPDSTTRSPRRQRRSRRRFGTKQMNKSMIETSTELAGTVIPSLIKPTAPEIIVA